MHSRCQAEIESNDELGQLKEKSDRCHFDNRRGNESIIMSIDLYYSLATRQAL